MELSIEEQTLVASFRNLDDAGKRELLRHAAQQHKRGADAAEGSSGDQPGQCRLERRAERPEIAAEPIFTE